MSRTLTRLLMVGMITVVLAALFVYAHIRLANSATELQAALQTITNREAVAKEHQVVQTLLEETTADRARLATYIVAGDDGTINLLTALEARAAAHGVTIQDTRLDTLERDELDYDALEVRLSIEGTQVGVETFINELEGLAYALYITNLTMQREAGNGGTLEVRAQLTLAVSATDIDV